MITEEMTTFFESLSKIDNDVELVDFCRRKVLHGIPKVFSGDESMYYDFRKRISERFDVYFQDIFVTGSAKLGFSPHKRKQFDYDSDIDVAIVSAQLYEKIMLWILDYQLQLRANRRAVSDRELSQYHKFLEYGAMGWMRPDLLPTSFQVDALKDEWFDFFRSISHGRSEVGNYKVAGGVFKSHLYLEKYITNHFRSLKTSIIIKKGDEL